MVRREIEMPWVVGRTEHVLPGRIKIDERAQQVLVTGFADADGVLQPYVPVGGSINALPAKDVLTTVIDNELLGPLGIISSSEIDMREWERFIMILSSSDALGGGIEVESIENETGNLNLIKMIRSTGGASGSTTYNPIALSGVLASGGDLYLVKPLGEELAGTRFLIRITNNDGVNSSNITLKVRRFGRRHG